MADKKKFTYQIDAQLIIDQAQKQAKALSESLNKISAPKNITSGLENGIKDLEKEIKKYQDLTSKGFLDENDLKELKKVTDSISSSYNKLIKQKDNLTKSSKDDIKKFFPKEVSDVIKAASKALSDYEQKIKSTKNNIDEISAKIKATNELIKEKTSEIIKERMDIVNTHFLSAFFFSFTGFLFTFLE